MRTHDQLVKKLLRRRGVQEEWNALNRRVRFTRCLTQGATGSGADSKPGSGAQVPAVACLERALASGKHSPSIATLRKYVKACGKRLVLRVA